MAADEPGSKSTPSSFQPQTHANITVPEQRSTFSAGEDQKPRPTPVVMVKEITGVSTAENGEFVRIKIQTSKQEVELHLELPLVSQIISAAQAARLSAEQRAEKAGRPVHRTLFRIDSFACGDMQGLDGLVLTFNLGEPSELMCNIPEFGFCHQLAKGIAQAASTAERSRLAVPKPQLLGPGGQPIGNGSKRH